MPNRAPRPHNTKPKYGSKYSVSLAKPASSKEIQMEAKLKKDIELVIPNTVAGKLPNKRYSQIRMMKGVTMGDLAALCLMHERGEFPGELLFSGTRKQLLDKKYKKARIKARKELQNKWLGMRQERLLELDKAKEIVADKIKKGKIKVPKALQPKKKKSVKGVPRQKKDFPLSKVSPPSSYTDGTLPEINSPHKQ